MSKQQLFAIRDQKTEHYTQPWLAHTPGEAQRNFQRLVDDSNTQVGQFPTDYDLYSLGSYESSTGKITAHDTPQHIVHGAQLKKS